MSSAQAAPAGTTGVTAGTAAAGTPPEPGATGPGRSLLRRLPVPDSQPPYDDGGRTPGAQHPSASVVQGTLALAFVLPTGLPVAPEPVPGLRLLPPAPDAQAEADRVDFGPQPTPRAELPDPRVWAARFAQAVVEVLGGDRPLAQLVRWTSEEVYGALAADRALAGRRPAARAEVRSVHVHEPADGVAEVAAVVRRNGRATALAVRLEGLDGRWQCTALAQG